MGCETPRVGESRGPGPWRCRTPDVGDPGGAGLGGMGFQRCRFPGWDSRGVWPRGSGTLWVGGTLRVEVHEGWESWWSETPEIRNPGCRGQDSRGSGILGNGNPWGRESLGSGILGSGPHGGQGPLAVRAPWGSVPRGGRCPVGVEDPEVRDH